MATSLIGDVALARRHLPETLLGVPAYAGLTLDQLFNRYPVLKIHVTTARHVRKNTAVREKLATTGTSEIP
jgi:hypothetical protein